RASGEGRVAAIEVMLNTPHVSDLIAKGEIASLKAAIEQNVQDGSQSFDQALFELYRSKEITLQPALRQADSANNLRIRTKMMEAGAAIGGAATDAAPQFTIKPDDRRV